jgi:hypothetical protein
MYAGLIGVAFAIAEGAFLDRVKNAGTAAFSWLFLLGMVAGLVSAALFIPQADIPMVRQGARKNQLRLIRDTLQNRPLMLVTLYAVVWSLQGIAGFFPAAYMLRDLGVPFLGVGLVNAVATLTVLLSSPLWGRIVDRYGSRPVLIACSLFVCPLPLVWLFVSSPRAVYALVGPLNLLGGFASAGVSVALTTLLFKVTEGSGRSLQLAVYSIVVTLLAAVTSWTGWAAWASRPTSGSPSTWGRPWRLPPPWSRAACGSPKHTGRSNWSATSPGTCAGHRGSGARAEGTVRGERVAGRRAMWTTISRREGATVSAACHRTALQESPPRLQAASTARHREAWQEHCAY